MEAEEEVMAEREEEEINLYNPFTVLQNWPHTNFSTFIPKNVRPVLEVSTIGQEAGGGRGKLDTEGGKDEQTERKGTKENKQGVAGGKRGPDLAPAEGCGGRRRKLRHRAGGGGAT